MDREPLSKRRRFEVFKRDLFVCQYCGRTPPAVVLEVDHIVPVISGGSSDDHNLITACFDCNRGKSDGSLEATPIDVGQRREQLAERMVQTQAYEELLAEKRQRENETIDEIIEIYEDVFDGWTLLDRVRPSIRQFLDLLPKPVVIEAMELACARMNRSRAFRYFCGVCWNRVRERQ